MRAVNVSPCDSSRFYRLIKEHMSGLYAAALRMTKNRADAEDLVQNTCLKAFKNFESLREVDKVKSWLFRILTNTFINNYRAAAQKEKTISIDEVDEAAFVPWIKTPEQLLSDREISKEIVEALDSLHPEIRMVVWYADVEGFSYQEIAEVLSCSTGTVGSRLFRGRNQLKSMLRGFMKR